MTSPATIAIVQLDRQQDIFAKGVASRLSYYETAFDEVLAVFLHGRADPIVQGRTRAISVGGDNWRRDLVLSPYRLWKALRGTGVQIVLTYDVFYSWWTTVLARLLGGSKLVIVPVCLPDTVREIGQAPVSGLPRRIERICTSLSFRSARSVLAPTCLPSFPEWIEGFSPGRTRIRVIDPSIVEGFLNPEFYERSTTLEQDNSTGTRVPGSLLSVGRLHREKYPLDLIEVLHLIRRVRPDAHLTVVGDGPEHDAMVTRARELRVEAGLTIQRSLPNEEIAKLYLRSEVYVSPYTGMSLREAGTCGSAVVAYDLPGTVDFLRNEVNALLVAPGDVEGMAAAVLRLLGDRTTRERLGVEFRSTAENLWSLDRLPDCIAQTMAAFGINSRPVGRPPLANA
ncbi:MAG: glycosyltransferase [Acidimicrobiales bacterium]